jgi:ABC-type nitrate/sulfonate/bicarbonate transport system permease component
MGTDNAQTGTDQISGGIVAVEPDYPRVAQERERGSSRRFDGGNEAWISGRGRFLIGAASLLFVAVVWQLSTEVFHCFSLTFASAPTRVAISEYHYFFGGTGFSDTGKTGLEVLIGLFLAIVVGVPVGVTIALSTVFSAIFEPFLNLLYATPFIALAPLFVLWFGIGLTSKVVMVFIVSIIPIIVTTSAGVRTVESSLVSVARIYNAGPLQIFRTIVLPGTLPSTISGIRLAVGHALLGAVVAELIASTGGLGYTINVAGGSYDTDRLLAAIAVVAFAGLILASILRRIERRLDRWRVS